MNLLWEEKAGEIKKKTWKPRWICLLWAYNLPGSSLKPVRCPLENKTELITLTISNDNIVQFFHDRAGTPGHEPQCSVVIGLCKVVLLRKPCTEYRTKYSASNSVSMRICKSLLLLGSNTYLDKYHTLIGIVLSMWITLKLHKWDMRMKGLTGTRKSYLKTNSQHHLLLSTRQNNCVKHYGVSIAFLYLEM